MKLVVLAAALLAAFLVAGIARATLPTVTLSSPVAGVVSGTVTLNATASTGATEVRYYSDNVQIGIDSTCCTWDELWNTSTASEGAHSLTATARNAAGEVGTSAPVMVTVDNIPDPPPPVECNDGVNNDPAEDALVDYPSDPGCSSAADTSELGNPPPPPPPPPNGCMAGWYPVDAQSWWHDAPGPFVDAEAKHLHVGGCIPRRDTVLTGTVPFDLTLKLHNNDGRVTYVAIVVKTDTLESTYRSVNPGWTCPSADCVFTQHFDLPVSAFDKSGREEIRFRATTLEPNGKEIRASINFEAVIQNGKPLDDFGRMPYTRGKGWYTGLNYCESAYRDDLTPLPSTPVSGIWSPNIRQLDHGTDDANPTSWSIRVDPDIHHGNLGTFLGSGTGGRDGVFAINTAQLANGPHKLFIETECETSAGRNGGILVLPFEVQN